MSKDKGGILMPTIEDQIKKAQEKDPQGWLLSEYIRIDKAIQEYNNMAKEHGADLIVAMTMTNEELNQGMEEIFNAEIEADNGSD